MLMVARSILWSLAAGMDIMIVGLLQGLLPCSCCCPVLTGDGLASLVISQTVDHVNVAILYKINML
jgi:hypothetical protein